MGEHPCVMRDRRLALAERTLEVAAADLSLAGHDRKKAKAHRVTQRREEPCQLAGLRLWQLTSGDGGAAWHTLGTSRLQHRTSLRSY